MIILLWALEGARQNVSVIAELKAFVAFRLAGWQLAAVFHQRLQVFWVGSCIVCANLWANSGFPTFKWRRVVMFHSLS